MAEQVLEDVIVGGFGAIEVESSGDAQHPLALWPVDGATIRMQDGLGRIAGIAALCAGDGEVWAGRNIVLNDDELIYIRLNPADSHAVWAGAVGSCV